jgi:N6-adenosine-specific RNA methylase IME4
MSFATIVADPPWRFPGGKGRGSQYAWREGRASGKRRVLDYEQMTIEQIAALPVVEHAADDAHLFIWTTQHHLEATYGIARAWGFQPSCALVWCKAPHGWGPGGVFQSTVEFILYARRGQPKPRKHAVERQWWEWPRGEHSAKPDAFLDMIEAKFPAPRLEMFARRARFGWDYFGDQSLSTVELSA